jgi:hypothetical protein
LPAVAVTLDTVTAESIADAFWPTLTPAQRDGITAIAMDMWEPYVQSTRAHLPEADTKIVFDKFQSSENGLLVVSVLLNVRGRDVGSSAARVSATAAATLPWFRLRSGA